MYQHLLVPLDDTPLAQASIDHALALAGRLQARVTFFHARADFAASSDGAVLHAMTPSVFAQAAAGQAHPLLAKAQAAARTAQIQAQAHTTVSDQPHAAILQAVAHYGCDAIVMASHGRRGLKGALLGSTTRKVLQAASVPVIVTAVQSNLPHSAAQQALATIRDEHRSLAAVIHGLQHVLAQAQASQQPPDFALLRAMLFYIEQFPERLHHPKEESQLFRLLRQRTTAYDPVLAELEQQHRQGTALFAELRQALQHYETAHASNHTAASIQAAAHFTSAVERFAQSQWQHMATEENTILPAASAHLSEADWQAIAQAFQANHDPRLGQQASEAFEALCARILRLAAAAQPDTDTLQKP